MKNNDISKFEFIKNLKRLYDINFDELVNAKLTGSFKDEYFCLGFKACINCLEDIYKIKKNVDKEEILRYI